MPNWAPEAVQINEVLANVSTSFEKAIELCNTSSNSVDIGGWWLSNDPYARQKFQIPNGKNLPAGGFIVFYESDFNSGVSPFSLSELGDQVVLSAVDSLGNMTGYGSVAHFGASVEDVSYGRVAVTGLGPSSGGVEFWRQTATTLGQSVISTTGGIRTGTGASNSAPFTGPVIINEIMYHPADTNNTEDGSLNEFIEILNISSKSVDLSGWRLKGSSEFTFPTGTSMEAGACLLLVNFAPSEATNLAVFRNYYSLTNATFILGPYKGNLDNDTGDIEIAYPTNIAGSDAYILVDKVEYRDIAPWPVSPDGKGQSLQRISSSVIGNTASNWTGNTPTPGFVKGGNTSTETDYDKDGIPDQWEIEHGLKVGVDNSILDSDLDGVSDLDEYLAGTDPLSSTSKI